MPRTTTNQQDMNRNQKRESPRKDKAGMAAHFDVGIRTIENWLARRIISAQRKGRKNEFDVAECDRRVMSYKRL